MPSVMKRILPKLLVWGLLLAFVVMGVAMVMPHHHDAATVQHACWVCQAKAAGVAAPALSTQIDPQFVFTASLSGEEVSLFAWVFTPTQSARAPPLLSL